MITKEIVLLSVLVTQTLSAPSGCTESCKLYHTSGSSYQYAQTRGIPDQIVAQTHSNLHSQNALDLNFARPGNWTEHNQYATDGGHGRVYEEKSQYEDDSKRVRYHKKNYSSSYSSGDINTVLPTLVDSSSNQNYNLAHAVQNSELHNYHQTNLQSSNLRSGHSYDTTNHQLDSSLTGQRLEDLGEFHQSSLTSHQGVSGTDTQISRGVQSGSSNAGNWSEVNAYRTDGGRGRVYEEQGQYVTGPARVRYYKKNYTSSYSSSGIPITNVPSVHFDANLDNVRREFNNLRRELHHINTNRFDATSNQNSNFRDLGQSQVGYDYNAGNAKVSQQSDYHQQIESHHVNSNAGIQSNRGRHSDTYHQGTSDQVYPTYDQVSTGKHHQSHSRYYEDSVQSSTQDNINSYVNNHQDVQNIQQVQQPVYSQPSANVYGTEQHSSYQNQYSYTNRDHSPSQSPGYVSASNGNHRYYGDSQDLQAYEQQRRLQENRRSQNSNIQQSNVQSHTSHKNSNDEEYQTNVYRQPTMKGNVRHYEERWGSSSRTEGSYIPVQDISAQHVDHYNNQYSSYSRLGGQNTQSVQFGEQSRDEHHALNSGQSVTGVIDLGQMTQSADCTEGTQQIQHAQNYRRYRRDAKYHGSDNMYDTDNKQLLKQNEDSNSHNANVFENKQHNKLGENNFPQYNQPWPRKPTTNERNYEDYSQHSQQTQWPRKPATGDHGLENINQQNEDFSQHSQQTQWPSKPATGDLELENLNQQNEDFSQHSQQTQWPRNPVTGGLELENLNQQNEDFSQHSQQTQWPRNPVTGGLELENLDQQNEDFSQHSQQTQWPRKPETGEHELENMNQQNEDFSQHSQQTQWPRKPATGDHGLENINQQNEDFSQHSQQTQWPRNPVTGGLELENLNQQNEDFSQHSQQTQWPRNPVTGGLELENLDQQNEDFSQHSQQTQWPRKPETGEHELENMNQQYEDFSQHSQQTQWPRKPATGDHGLENINQQNEDFSQHSQQTQWPRNPVTGGLELENLNQQNEDFSQHSQQTQWPRNPVTGGLELENLDQQNEDFSQHSQQTQWPRKPETGDHGLENINQQNADFSQHSQQTQWPSKPATGGLELENLNQQYEDFNQHSQQTQWPRKPETGEHELENMNQQNEDFSQHSQQTQWPRKPATGDHGLENINQQNEDFSQHSQQTQWPRNPVTGSDSPISSSHDSNQPAPKPKPRSRPSTPSYGQSQNAEEVVVPGVIPLNLGLPNYEQESITHVTQSSDIDIKKNMVSPKIDIETDAVGVDLPHLQNEKHHPKLDSQYYSQVSDSVKVNEFNQENEDKFNKWHYRHHSSDLTNSESSSASTYPSSNIVSSSVADRVLTSSHGRSQTYDKVNRDVPGVKSSYKPSSHYFAQNKPFSHEPQNYYEQQPGNIQQTTIISKQENDSFPQLTSKNITDEELKLAETYPQLRILEAYGGGPYDKSHDDSIYVNVPPNPDATLPPFNNNGDPWDIREKASETFISYSEMTVEPLSFSTTSETNESTTPKPKVLPTSFWGRIGYKFTTTFDKAKEKARDIFG